MSKNKFDNYTREQLYEKIKQLEKQRYGLVWEDKQEKVAELCDLYLPVLKEIPNKSIKTKQPMPYNLLIEGDNYHALYSLNFTHNKKIDIIYIDPPYNTGKKDFIYNDKYVDKEDTFRHSKWLSFMYKRLRLAKNLLKDSGVIFISIDDIESAQLKLICDKIFSESNFIAKIVWNSKTGSSDATTIDTITEYVYVYAKNINHVKFNNTFTAHDIKRYKLKDSFISKRGPYYLDNLDRGGLRYSDSLNYPIICPDKTIIYPNGRQKFLNDGWTWKWSKDKVKWGIKNSFIEFKKNKQGRWVIYYKNYLNVDNEDIIKERGIAFKNLIVDIKTGDASKVIKELFGYHIIKYSKPYELIQVLLSTVSKKSSLILDFFAGSGTTAHSVLELNKLDNGHRQFILCTNNENKICTKVCYPRIKKVIQGYKFSVPIPSRLKYFKTDFVPKVITDNDKRVLVRRSTELLCIAENTFDLVKKSKRKNEFVLYKNLKQLTAIIYDEDAIFNCKLELNRIKPILKTVIYVFSYDHEYNKEDFEDLKIDYIVKPIPEVILNVYRKNAKIKR